MVKKEEKKFDLSTFTIEQVENGWKVKSTDHYVSRGWAYFGDVEWTAPKTFVFADKPSLMAWIEKNV